jgi:MFS family permease
MAMFGAITFVPLYLQAVTGSTAMQAGFVLVPFVFGWVVCSIVAARLVLRVSYRSIVVTGMCFLTAAFVLLAGWSESLTRGAAMRDITLAGVGMGLVFVPMLIAVQSAVPRSVLGSATSVTGFFRSIGGAVGVAIMGSIMAQRLHLELSALLTTARWPAGVGTNGWGSCARRRSSSSATAPVFADILDQMRPAMAHAVGSVFVVGLVVALAALASSLPRSRGTGRVSWQSPGARDALGIPDVPATRRFSNRLAGLPPVPVAELLALLDRLPEPGRDPMLAGLAGVDERAARHSPDPDRGDRAPQAEARSDLLRSATRGAHGHVERRRARAVVARFRAAGLPADDLLFRLERLSPTLGLKAENREWARAWMADPTAQDANLVQHCMVHLLLALRGLAGRAPALLTDESSSNDPPGGRMIHLHEKNQERKRLNGLIAKSTMKVPAAVGEVGKRVFSDGALSKKHKELTALTVAVVQNCFD